MKKILLSIAILSIAIFSNAQQRTEAEAAAIAKAFMQNNGHDFNITKSTKAAKMRAQKAGDIVPYYIFNDTRKGGFVIVGGQEAMSDILAYSDEDCFDTNDIPPAAAMWLDVYSQCAVAAADNPEKSMAEKKAAAKAFVKSNFSRRQNVEPLLGEIKYNQGAPYNKKCPTFETTNGSKRHAYTGCTQTAQAMVMRYWKHPERPTGNKSYTFSRPDATSQDMTLSIDFDEEKPYDWDNMLPRYEGHSYTDEQADAIATLMYHCGISNEAEYGLSVTLAAINYNGLVNYFGYADDIVIDSYTSYKEKPNGDNQFLTSLIDEISQRRPIIAGGWATNGASHYYVIDGYDINNLLHFNLGWNGTSDGFYEVVPVPKVEYGLNMYIVRNIHPDGRLTPTSPVRRVVVEAGLGNFNPQTTNIKSALNILGRSDKYGESLIRIITADCIEEAEYHLEGLGNIQGVLIDRCDTVAGTVSTTSVESSYKKRYNTDAPANIDIDAVFTSESSIKVSVAALFSKNISDADYRYSFVYTENNAKIGGTTYNDLARGRYPDNSIGYENSLPANLEEEKEYIFEQEIPMPLEIENIDNATLIVMMIDAKSGEIVNANTIDLKQMNDWREKQKPSFVYGGKLVASGTTIDTYSFDEEAKRMSVPVRLNNPRHEPMKIVLTAEVIELGENCEVQLGETAGDTMVTYSLPPLSTDSTMMLYLNINDEFKSSKSTVKLAVNYNGKTITEQTVNFDFIETTTGTNTFTVRVTGTLNELIPQETADTLTTITLTGRLGGKDIAYLRDSLKAKSINLSKANIVKDNTQYYGNYTTENDIIGARMFSKIEAEHIVLPETAIKIDNYAFYQNANLTKIVIGKSVTNIGNFAFSGCKQLSTVTLPANVTGLGRTPFKDCPLEYLICESDTPATISAKTFENTIANVTLVVPTDAAVETYKATNIWSSFGNIISYEKFLTNVSPAAEETTVKVENGIIVIEGDTEATIYTFSGNVAAKGCAGEYSLPAGSYIVKTGNKVVKVSINKQ